MNAFYGGAFGNEYLWYLHAIGMIYIVVYLVDKLTLFYKGFPCLLLLYWIMSEGTSIVLSKSVLYFLYRNWLVECIGFYYIGKWAKQKTRIRKSLYITMVATGSVMTILEYSAYGRMKFYLGSMLIVYGILALGKSINLKENVFFEIGSKHSLHLYLYSPFVAFIFSLL